MRILLSNDDGYLAPGIRILQAHLEAANLHESLMLIAPERNRSAASHSLTLTEPLRIFKHEAGVFSVNGTPTDCVHLGVNGGVDFVSDMVISGINAGANMGDDVLYSGTVAAAMEGRFLGKPSIAVSLVGNQHFDTAAKVVVKLLQQMATIPLDSATILNINVPDLPEEQIQGIKITRLGQRHCSEPVVRQTDPRGHEIHWIGPAGEAADASEGTDFWAIEQGYVSITPLKIDLTHYEMKTLLENRLAL